MDRVSTESSRAQVAQGGWSLIAATALFALVFVYLAQVFDYPQVLDRPAGEVLPRLLGLGGTGRAVWLLYGLIPLLLLPTALGVRALGRPAAPRVAGLALLLAGLSAFSMMAGLLRWPTLHWQLALAQVNAGPEAQALIAARFDAANLWLGNVVGEFLGELFLNAFFVAATWVVYRASAQPSRLLLASGLVSSLLGWVAMLRNLTAWVEPVAALNNVVLPVWMMLLGIALVAEGGSARPQRLSAARARGPA